MVQAGKRWQPQTGKKGDFDGRTIYKSVGRIKENQQGAVQNPKTSNRENHGHSLV